MIHYVYKIINLQNNLYYIGSRTHPNPEKDKYMSSSKIMKNLYKLEGINNFKKEILRIFKTREEANKYEDTLIKILLHKEPEKIYNLRRSGCKSTNKNIFNKRNDIWVDFYQEIRYKYLNGVKIFDLSQFYNCDIGTIHVVIEDLKNGNKWSNAWLYEEEIIKYYNDGFSRKFISKKYKCDIKTIKNILLKNNINIRPIGEQQKINKQKGILQGKKKTVDIKKFEELYIDNDWSMNEVAEYFKIYNGTAKKIALENNIPIKSRNWSCKQPRHQAWSQKDLIKEDIKNMNKKEILQKYNIKDYSTLNKILKS